MKILLAAIVVAPVAWVLLALGQERSTAAFATQGGGLQAGAFVRPLLFLAAAGLLLGILGTLRFSPLGAIVIGALFTTSSALLMVAPARVLDVFGDFYVAGRHVDLAAPIRSGTTMVLGVLLLVGAVSVQRWRRWPRSGDEPPQQAMAAERPLGTEGLGLTPAFRDREFDRDLAREFGREPEITVRNTTMPEPWQEPFDDRRAAPAGRPPGAW
jgi:hypothetical protein